MEPMQAMEQQVATLLMQELEKAGIHVVPSELQIPISVSGRHLHLSQEHLETLFGRGFEMQVLRDISQPGQFASEQTVTLQGPKGSISNLRVLGPQRNQTQIELAMSDARRIGLSPPVRASGDIKNSAGGVLIGPKGSVVLSEGIIIAERHIHVTPDYAALHGLQNGQLVDVRVDTPKGGIFSKVAVHVRDDFALDMHIDADDANAFLIPAGCMGTILKSSQGC